MHRNVSARRKKKRTSHQTVLGRDAKRLKAREDFTPTYYDTVVAARSFKPAAEISMY